MHHAIDHHSRLAYSEILTDEKKETAAAFWKRARSFFADAGIAVRAVMTDNETYGRLRRQEGARPVRGRRLIERAPVERDAAFEVADEQHGLG